MSLWSVVSDFAQSLKLSGYRVTSSGPRAKRPDGTVNYAAVMMSGSLSVSSGRFARGTVRHARHALKLTPLVQRLYQRPVCDSSRLILLKVLQSHNPLDSTVPRAKRPDGTLNETHAESDRDLSVPSGRFIDAVLYQSLDAGESEATNYQLRTAKCQAQSSKQNPTSHPFPQLPLNPRISYSKPVSFSVPLRRTTRTCRDHCRGAPVTRSISQSILK